MLTQRQINIKRKLSAAFRGRTLPVDQCEHKELRKIAGMRFCPRCGADLPAETSVVVEPVVEPVALADVDGNTEVDKPSWQLSDQDSE